MHHPRKPQRQSSNPRLLRRVLPAVDGEYYQSTGGTNPTDGRDGKNEQVLQGGPPSSLLNATTQRRLQNFLQLTEERLARFEQEQSVAALQPAKLSI